MALKRLEKEYEATIKAEIKDKDKEEEKEEKMMIYESDSDDDNQHSNQQTYQRLEEVEEINKFGEFEEYGDSNNKSEENNIDVKSLEFFEESKGVQNNNINNNEKEVKSDYLEEKLSNQDTSQTLVGNINNTIKFNETDKERIKNAMKQINIKPPNWAKK